MQSETPKRTIGASGGHDSAPPCPVCQAAAKFEAFHPDADLYRCPACDHCFSRLESMRRQEAYDQTYFEETHRDWFAHPNIELFDSILAALGGSGGVRSMIDVGCGKGQFLDRAAERMPDVALVGLDLFSNSPRPGISFVHGDIFTTPLDRRFDAVVTMGTIEHVPDVRFFVERLKKLCVPGGHIVIMTVNERSFSYEVGRILKGLGMPIAFNRIYDRHHLNHFNLRSLRRLLDLSGLEVIRTLHTNPPLRATQIPVRSRMAWVVLKMGVWVTYTLGRLFHRTFLQTVICRNP